MKKTAICALALLLCMSVSAAPALAARMLIPVGQVIGLELRDGSVTVAEFDEVLGQAARAAGLRLGDKLLKIDDTPLGSAEDVRHALERSRGQVELTVLRQGQTIKLRMKPQITSEGPKLGLLLRQGVTGIGTVTYYDPDSGCFGCLGHGVGGSQGLTELLSGSAYDARVASVRPGEAGKPGLLRGAVDSSQVVGSLRSNTNQGVFGTTEIGWAGTPLPVAACQEVKTGKAVIRSTVAGKDTQEYSVEILKIYPKEPGEGRNLLIRVTDQRLLELTGGIVQGMSGSPILQNGKLVGAVTHVLVNDPTTGYGIFIENMLDAAA